MILGASFDTPEANRVFRRDEGFPYRLLSDTDRSVGTAYHADRGPDHDHPDYPRRITYLIDPVGMIALAYEVEDRAAHADEVLADLHALVARWTQGTDDVQQDVPS